MLVKDIIKLTARSVIAQRMRSFLTALGIAIGVAAVVLLTSIGDGLHRFVLAEFTQFGTNLIGINPGKATTHGAAIGVFGTERPLTIDDAVALEKLRDIEAVVPLVQGNAEVESSQRQRRTTVYGMGGDMPRAFRAEVALGQFFIDDDPNNPRAVAVLGSKLRSELFGDSTPLDKRIRIGGDRYRVIGVFEPKGQFLGVDLDDAVYIPAARALEMFNRDSLVEVDLLYREDADVDEIVSSITRLMTARHGRDDITITTQQQMLDVLGSVLGILTFAVAALGSISLLVGSVGIFTIMTIAVNERIAEIGLLRALGGKRNQVMTLFLGEAVVLAALGGLLGLLIGVGGAQLVTILAPALPVHISWNYLIAAELLAIFIGIVAGVLPARRAAKLDPIEALRSE
jgi:putative ABC transport system permease protein